MQQQNPPQAPLQCAAGMRRHVAAPQQLSRNVPQWRSPHRQQLPVQRRANIARAEREGRRTPKVTVVKTRKSLVDTIQISALFAAWYLSNIYFNIYNKQVLTAFGHAAMCTWLHLLVSSTLAALLWVARVRARPQVTPRVLDIIFPLALLHAVGFYSTNASLGAVNVSLTHTIKSMEPFFTVALSWALMRARPAKRVLAALVPIVVGVVIASATDLSFNWLGFIAAMASNLAFQLRNVLSKKAMLRTSYESLEGGLSDVSALDEVNIFALMSMGACAMMLPFVATADLPSLLTVGVTPAAWMSTEMWIKVLLAGVCRCTMPHTCAASHVFCVTLVHHVSTCHAVVP